WEFAWQGMMLHLPAASAPASQFRYCTVQVLDPKSGQCLQALNVVKPGLARQGVELARTAYSLSPTIHVVGAAAPAVHLTPERLLVMQGLATTAFDVTAIATGQSSPGNASP